MSQHESSGRTLVIHSVTISPAERRKGLGSVMLRKYVEKMVESISVDKILLLSKSDMLTFYVNCGFKLIRLSDVAHGQVHSHSHASHALPSTSLSTLSTQDKWYEMGLDLADLRGVEQIQVDAFAPVPFSGNPAAVIFEHRDDQWMQNVAMENNLAETSFLQVVLDMPYTYYLRW